MNKLNLILILSVLYFNNFLYSFWFNEIKDKKLLKFDYPFINHLLNEAKHKALLKYSSKKYFFLITNDENLFLEGFSKKNIDEIDPILFTESLFIVFFHTDDDYFYTLKKIKDNKGIFFSLPHFLPKTHYLYVDKNCAQAIDYSFGQPTSHHLIDVHETICQCINATKSLPGDYVEIGVFMGGSAVTALSYMKYSGINRTAYFLDTFNGMTNSEAAESSDVIWQDTHILWGVDRTVEHLKNLFSKITTNFKIIPTNISGESLPNEIKQIAVCNIDVDIYEATFSALVKVSSLIVVGGIIICEDPTSMPGLGGALLAMEEFLMTIEGKKYIKILSGGQYLLIKLRN